MFTEPDGPPSSWPLCDRRLIVALLLGLATNIRRPARV